MYVYLHIHTTQKDINPKRTLHHLKLPPELLTTDRRPGDAPFLLGGCVWAGLVWGCGGNGAWIAAWLWSDGLGDLGGGTGGDAEGTVAGGVLWGTGGGLATPGGALTPGPTALLPPVTPPGTAPCVPLPTAVLIPEIFPSMEDSRSSRAWDVRNSDQYYFSLIDFSAEICIKLWYLPKSSLFQ